MHCSLPRLLYSGLSIMLGPGFPIAYGGPNLGVRNDSRMFASNALRRASYFPWEYSLGDKAYVGLAEFLTEFKLHKGAELSELQLEWNEMLQFYRGRNEHLVAEIKNGRCLEAQWRHSYPLLCAVVRLVTHMVAL